jgi:hypothetical protein
VGDIPGGVGAGVGHVEREVFELHGGGGTERGGRGAAVNAAVREIGHCARGR